MVSELAVYDALAAGRPPEPPAPGYSSTRCTAVGCLRCLYLPQTHCIDPCVDLGPMQQYTLQNSKTNRLLTVAAAGTFFNRTNSFPFHLCHLLRTESSARAHVYCVVCECRSISQGPRWLSPSREKNKYQRMSCFPPARFERTRRRSPRCFSTG